MRVAQELMLRGLQVSSGGVRGVWQRHSLLTSPRVDPKTPRRFPPAYPFNLNRKTNLSV